MSYYKPITTGLRAITLDPKFIAFLAFLALTGLGNATNPPHHSNQIDKGQGIFVQHPMGQVQDMPGRGTSWRIIL